MMVVHIALFSWKESVSAEQVQEALEEVRSLEQKVEGLERILCGENFSRWAEGYTHAVVVLAENQSALDAYRNHPDHEAVARRIEEMEVASLGVDFVA